jgi:hypothetical protein
LEIAMLMTVRVFLEGKFSHAAAQEIMLTLKNVCKPGIAVDNTFSISLPDDFDQAQNMMSSLRNAAKTWLYTHKLKKGKRLVRFVTTVHESSCVTED